MSKKKRDSGDFGENSTGSTGSAVSLDASTEVNVTADVDANDEDVSDGSKSSDALEAEVDVTASVSAADNADVVNDNYDSDKNDDNDDDNNDDSEDVDVISNGRETPRGLLSRQMPPRSSSQSGRQVSPRPESASQSGRQIATPRPSSSSPPPSSSYGSPLVKNAKAIPIGGIRMTESNIKSPQFDAAKLAESKNAVYDVDKMATASTNEGARGTNLIKVAEGKRVVGGTEENSFTGE